VLRVVSSRAQVAAGETSQDEDIGPDGSCLPTKDGGTNLLGRTEKSIAKGAGYEHKRYATCINCDINSIIDRLISLRFLMAKQTTRRQTRCITSSGEK
jgi:hypothetical protein